MSSEPNVRALDCLASAHQRGGGGIRHAYMIVEEEVLVARLLDLDSWRRGACAACFIGSDKVPRALASSEHFRPCVVVGLLDAASDTCKFPALQTRLALRLSHHPAKSSSTPPVQRRMPLPAGND